MNLKIMFAETPWKGTGREGEREGGKTTTTFLNPIQAKLGKQVDLTLLYLISSSHLMVITGLVFHATDLGILAGL